MPSKQTRSALLIAACGLMLAGCVERQIRVTSTPPGARVWLNDQEIGVTPCESRFTFYGGYDLRLEKPGFEALHEYKTAHAPVHEYPVVDLVATAAPSTVTNTIEWHFDLTPAAERSMDPEQALTELIDRADDLRARAEDTESE